MYLFCMGVLFSKFNMVGEDTFFSKKAKKIGGWLTIISVVIENIGLENDLIFSTS